MVAIRFGIFYEHQLPRPWNDGDERRLYEDALEQIEIADRLGFDYVWEVEHHFLEEYSHSSAPEVFLAAASQRTKRIRLGHGIVQIPPAVNHPARVAERLATLDLVSGGRVDLGTGEASSSAELGGFGVRRASKRAMWEDAIEAISRMFVEEPFAGWESQYFQMPPRNVVPKPLQKPHPPLWVACSRRETIHLAARKGMGALTFSFIEPEDAGKWVTEYYRLLESEECVPAGFAVNPNISVVLPMMCHEDEQTAIDRGIDGAHFFGYSLAHYYGESRHEPGRTNIWEEFQEFRETRGFSREAIYAEDAPLGVQVMRQNVGSLRGAVGTPDQIAELVRRYEAVGVDQIVFVMQAGTNRHEHICESLELFGKDVIPEFAARRDSHERDKKKRLAPAIEAALARRKPARGMLPGYRIDEEAERVRARHAQRSAQRGVAGRAKTRRADLRNAAIRRGRNTVARVLKGRSDAQLERGFGSLAQRAFFVGMARNFQPKLALGFEGEVEFQLTRSGSDEANTWTIEIKGNRARSRSGSAENPALTLRLGSADFLRLIGGEADPVALLLDGRLSVGGDFTLAPRVGEMFGGPSPF